MRVPALVSLVALLCLAPLPAWAGDLSITSVGPPVVVLQGGKVLGTTPFTLDAVPAGPLELGFRETLLSATVFTQVLAVPGEGALYMQINLPERTAAFVDPPKPGAPAVATSAPAATPETTKPAVTPPPPPAQPVAQAAAPASATPAASGGGTGDIFVVTKKPGVAIFLDGKAVGASTPYMLRGVPAGQHTVQVRTDCARAGTSVQVTQGAIARADLEPVEVAGALFVNTLPSGARVLLDGMDEGKAPLTLKELTCGDHALVVRAPGFLEASRIVKVLGGDTVSVELVPMSSASPAPDVPAPVDPLNVRLLIQKEEFGSLVLDVTPLEATVTVDGIEVGAGPRSIDKIAAGSHAVAGRLEGYLPMEFEIDVKPNAPSRAMITLTPMLAPDVALPGSLVQPSTSEATTVAAATSTSKLARPPATPPPAWLGRAALNGGVTLVGIGAGVYSVLEYAKAADAYERFATVESDDAAQTIYSEQVTPARTRAFVAGGMGLAALAGAAGLWITTDF